MDSQFGGFGIANLTNHDDIRVLAEEGAQARSKSKINIRINLGLVNAFNMILNRVLQG